jgi:hypothetical protein
MVAKPVEVRAEWQPTRPPTILVTVDRRPFAHIDYRPYQPGWAVEFHSATSELRGPIPVESIGDALPEELEADEDLSAAALSSALQIAASRLARRPLHLRPQPG